MLKVAVANQELLNERGLFAVPLAEETARQLFLGATSEADTSQTPHFLPPRMAVTRAQRDSNAWQ